VVRRLINRCGTLTVSVNHGHYAAVSFTFGLHFYGSVASAKSVGIYITLFGKGCDKLISNIAPFPGDTTVDARV